MHMFCWLACLYVLINMPIAMVRAASLQDLLPHRAVYNLQLEQADDKTGILSLTGRMVYDFSGSICEGFTTKFRYVSRLEMAETAPRIHDQQTSIFESGNGDELRVINKNYTDTQLSDELEASAWRQEEGLMVEVTKPEKKIHHLSPALFPNAQMVEMLQKAEAGENFYQTTLYDNFETGDKITHATVIIGSPRSLEADMLPPSTSMPANGPIGEQVWPVTISYFDDEKNPEGLPTYQSHFLLDKQGVSYNILFDYGDFSMRARLSQLDIFAQSPCTD